MPIKAFNDIPRRSLPQREGVGGFADLRSVAAIQVGIGARAFKADQSGIWLGGNKWADAPFRVDMQGNVVATSATFSAYLTKVGTDQELSGDIQVGSVAGVKIDGVNRRIIIYDDESVPNTVIGYVA